jgi:hypothetical protein
MFQGLGVEDIEDMEVVEHTLALYLGMAHPGILALTSSSVPSCLGMGLIHL